MPSKTPNPSPTSEPTVTQIPRISIEGIQFTLPDNWCRMEKDRITSFCPNSMFADYPYANIEINVVSSRIVRGDAAFEWYFRDWHIFDVEFIRYIDTNLTADGEEVFVAKYSIFHPDYLEEPEPILLSTFTHGDTTYVLKGDLIFYNPSLKDDFIYVSEIMTQIIYSTSFTE